MKIVQIFIHKDSCNIRHIFFPIYFQNNPRCLSLLDSPKRVTSTTLTTQGKCPWIVTQHPPVNFLKESSMLPAEVMPAAGKCKVKRCSDSRMDNHVNQVVNNLDWFSNFTGQVLGNMCCIRY